MSAPHLRDGHAEPLGATNRSASPERLGKLPALPAKVTASNKSGDIRPQPLTKPQTPGPIEQNASAHRSKRSESSSSASSTKSATSLSKEAIKKVDKVASHQPHNTNNASYRHVPINASDESIEQDHKPPQSDSGSVNPSQSKAQTRENVATSEDPFADNAAIEPSPIPAAHPAVPPIMAVHKAVSNLNPAASRPLSRTGSTATISSTRSSVSQLTSADVAGTALNYNQMAVKVVVRVRNVYTYQNQNQNASRPGTGTSSIDSKTPSVDDPQKVCINLSSPELSNKLEIVDPKGEKGGRSFNFDSVFGMETNQETVYEVAVHPLIQKCLEGYNGCVFAYGQTASGKTHTMAGPGQRMYDSLNENVTSLHADTGLISRVVHQLNNHVKQHRGKLDEASGNCIDFVIKVSYLEIYNETLIDLLVDKDKQESLKIRMEPGSTSGKDLYVQNLSERYISNLQDYRRILEVGAKNRTTGETNMNEASSRSHSILTITVDQYLVEQKKPSTLARTESAGSLHPEVAGPSEHSPEVLAKIGMGRRRSKIHLIDLAGSERADSTGATGARLREGAQINQSLSALGNVISALTSPAHGGAHIPYRDSKLTYLLSDSLGGNALTLMITCCSPTGRNYQESVSTLRFAERVKKVQNKATVNMDKNLIRIAELEAEILRLNQLLALCTCHGVGGIMAKVKGNEEDMTDDDLPLPEEVGQRECPECARRKKDLAELNSTAIIQPILTATSPTANPSSRTGSTKPNGPSTTMGKDHGKSPVHKTPQKATDRKSHHFSATSPAQKTSPSWWSSMMLKMKNTCGCGVKQYRKIGVEEDEGPILSTHRG
ncbi:Kinesin-like protein kif21b [Chytriomyces hyalinus]|nr:Kinesin-like protein kif21b [Chytriomyces hyalinus]